MNMNVNITKNHFVESFGPIPLFVGITGHRDIPKEYQDVLVQKIQDVLEHLTKTYPHTSIKLLSMLAAGADSLGAQAALNLGIDVIGILPFELELYRKDFAGDELTIFETLYLQCSKVYTMPYYSGITKESILQPGVHRDSQYAYGGAFLSRFSSVLIALWDGKDKGLRGGTAEVVRSQLNTTTNEFLPHLDYLHGKHNGPVYWLFTPRESNPEQENTIPGELPFDCLRGSLEYQRCKDSNEKLDVLYPTGWVLDNITTTKSKPRAEYDLSSIAQEYYHSNRNHLDRFNKDALKLYRQQGLSSQSPSDTADSLAKKYQKKTRRSIKVLLALGVISFGFMVIFSEVLIHGAVLLGFLISLMSTWMYYRHRQKKDVDGKYFDYRSLAELLRVMIPLHSLGEYSDPSELASPKQQSLLAWICNAARSSCIEQYFLQKTVSRDNLETLLETWVKGQELYHNHAVIGRVKSQRVREAVRLGLFAGALLTVVGFFLLRFLTNDPNLIGESWLDFSRLKYHTGYFPSIGVVLQVAFSFLLSTGAAFALYMHVRAFKDEIRLFQRSHLIFRRSYRLMKNALEEEDYSRFKALAKELGREAVSENFEWNGVHRSIPVEMPMG
jgi:hypothetical protein